MNNLPEPKRIPMHVPVSKQTVDALSRGGFWSKEMESVRRIILEDFMKKDIIVG